MKKSFEFCTADERTLDLHKLIWNINIDQKVCDVSFFLFEREVSQEPMNDRIDNIRVARNDAFFVILPVDNK